MQWTKIPKEFTVMDMLGAIQNASNIKENVFFVYQLPGEINIQHIFNLHTELEYPADLAQAINIQLWTKISN